jgi:arsenate reductase
MAEAFLRKYGNGRFEPHSAGLEPKGVNPLTVKVMDEVGIDISNQTSKGIETYLGKMSFQYLVTVCDDADKNCPPSGPESTKGCTGHLKIRLASKAPKRKNSPSSGKCGT